MIGCFHFFSVIWFVQTKCLCAWARVETCQLKCHVVDTRKQIFSRHQTPKTIIPIIWFSIKDWEKKYHVTGWVLCYLKPLLGFICYDRLTKLYIKLLLESYPKQTGVCGDTSILPCLVSFKPRLSSILP